MCSGLHVKYPLFLSEFNETQIFSTVFQKILNYQISGKSVQWEPSCSMFDRQTDIMKLIVTLHDFECTEQDTAQNKQLIKITVKFTLDVHSI